VGQVALCTLPRLVREIGKLVDPTCLGFGFRETPRPWGRRYLASVGAGLHNQEVSDVLKSPIVLDPGGGHIARRKKRGGEGGDRS
jgi:hypothetical protein